MLGEPRGLFAPCVRFAGGAPENWRGALALAAALLSACSSSEVPPPREASASEEAGAGEPEGGAVSEGGALEDAPANLTDADAPEGGASIDGATNGDDAGPSDLPDAAPGALDAGDSAAGGPEAGDPGAGELEAGGEVEAGDGQGRSLLDDPLRAFPESFAEVGLYPVRGDFDVVDPRVTLYTPRHPLWSNGGAKDRFIALPTGGVIDVSDRHSWQFPVGTLLFKSFFFRTEPGAEPRAVETRVLRRGEEEWEYAAYVWAEDGSDAALSDMRLPIPVSVLGPNDERFEHLVPSLRQCGRCHDAGLSNVLGFGELQLNDADFTAPSQLETFDGLGYFDALLPEPALRVEIDDPLSAEVVGYLQGNCVPCHNGQDSELNAFDMRADVALANLIEQPTQSNASARGIRIDPGSPETSIAFLAFSGETDDPEVQSMPSVGVQLRDAQAIELMRAWILSLESAADGGAADAGLVEAGALGAGDAGLSPLRRGTSPR